MLLLWTRISFCCHIEAYELFDRELYCFLSSPRGVLFNKTSAETELDNKKKVACFNKQLQVEGM